MECKICYSDDVNKLVKCGFCDYEACVGCASRYVTERALNPTCANCSKPWSRKTLFESFGKKFVNEDLKRARQTEMFEREKALFPETQLAMERQYATTVEKLRKPMSAKLRTVLKTLRQCEKDASCFGETALATEMAASIRTAADIVERVSTLPVFDVPEHERDLRPLPEHERDLRPLPGRKTPEPKRLTVKCSKDECRGYVDENNPACGLCGTRTCAACRETETTNHACDPATVETVNLIKGDTKPCPKCSVPIHKIDGCDQMFCVVCQTAFSWNTGETTDGPVHNPHYFEYMRLNAAHAPPAACDNVGIPSMYSIRQHERHTDVCHFMRYLVHFRNVELNKFKEKRADNEDLRIAYLKNQIDRKTFGKRLQERDKAACKRRDHRDALDTLIVAGSDMLRIYAATKPDNLKLREFRQSRTQLLAFVNELLTDAWNAYGGTRYSLDIDVTSLLKSK